MTEDDQYIIDTLVALPNEILRYSIDLTDALERRVDQLALQIRESLASATWLPPSARPSPPPQRFAASSLLPPIQPKGVLLWAKDWVSEHRAITAAVIAFAGTGTFIYWKRQREYVRKRRAKRAANGHKCEVVVVAGTVNTSFPRSLVQDLERRGFIVYVVVSDIAEEETVKAEAKPDIIPLHLDVTNPHDLQTSIANFTEVLRNTATTTGSTPLHLAGLILAPYNPTTPYPPSPLETTDPALLSDALNTRILHPTAILQALLPALADHKGRILVLSPGTTPATLRLPFHSVEAAVVAAMDALTATLAAETRPLGVPVIRFRLGSFEYGHAGTDGRQLQVRRPAAAEMLAWSPAARQAYGKAYRAWVGEPGTATEPGGRWSVGGAGLRTKGSPLRELNNAVFDALSLPGTPTEIWRVGRGSWIYELVGRLTPLESIGWAVGLRAASRAHFI